MQEREYMSELGTLSLLTMISGVYSLCETELSKRELGAL